MFDGERDGWRAGCIGALIYEVANRVDPGQDGDLNRPYVGLEHIEQGTGRLSGCGRASQVVSQKSVFDAGDILYGKLRPNLRKVARPDFGGVCSTDIVVFRAKVGADADFAFQLLQSDPVVAHAVASAAGTKMPRTHARSILAVEAALPPLDEQRRIAEVLRSLDEAAVTASKVSQQADVVRDALIATAFDGEGELVPLGTACSLIYRYPGFYGFEQREEGVPVIRGEHLRNGRISTDWSEFYFVNPDFSGRFPKTVLQKNDVVMSVRGTVGTTALVEESHVGSQISPNLIRLVADPKRLLPRLLYYAVQSAVAHMRATLVNAQALPAINAGDIKKVEIALPPLDQQHELLDRLEAATNACSSARHAHDQLQVIRREIASDLLSSRVRVRA